VLSTERVRVVRDKCPEINDGISKRQLDSSRCAYNEAIKSSVDMSHHFRCCYHRPETMSRNRIAFRKREEVDYVSAPVPVVSEWSQTGGEE
jgi:hypothetical protein